MTYLIASLSQLAVALKSARKGLGLTQSAAAAKVGLLPKTVSALENHPESCSIESLFKYLSALELELSLSPKASISDSPEMGDWQS